MIRDECRAHGLAAASLRYFNVAGASGELGEDHEPETHLIPLVLQAAAGVREHVKVFGTDYPTRDGTAVRDYIHVEDLGEAHLLALDALEPGRTAIFNLGSGDGYTVREVIDAARRVTGREIPVREEGRRPGDPPALVAANAQARERARLGAAARARRDDRRRVGLAPGAPARLRAEAAAQRGDAVGQHRGRLLRGVDHGEALGLGGRERVVRGADRVEEGELLALEPVAASARSPARASPARGSIRSSSVRSGVRPPVANRLSARISSTPRPRPAPW